MAYYVTTDGVDQTIDAPGFLFPSTGIIRIAVDRELFTGGGGIQITTPSSGSIIFYSPASNYFQISFTGTSQFMFGAGGYTFVRGEQAIELDFDLGVIRCYGGASSALLGTFTATSVLSSLGGTTSTSLTWGKRINDYSQSDVYAFQILENAVLVRDYDPSLSNGTGLVVPDGQGGTSASLSNYNPPNDDSQWVFYGAAGGNTIDGVFNLPALTAAGSITNTLPQPIINGAFALPALTVVGSITNDTPQPIINGAFNLPALSVVGSITNTLPQPIINGAFSLPALTVSGDVTNTLPQPTINGVFNLPALTASGDITNTLPQPAIDGAFSMPLMTVAGDITNSEPASPVINGAFSMPVLTVLGDISNTLPEPIINGAFSMPLISVSGQIVNVLPQPIINGLFSMPLLQANGSITVELPQPEISGAFSMPAISVQGFITMSGVEIVIDTQTNINQIFLNSSINQVFFSANINQESLSNNINYN
jgi:hypothetical protein